MANSDLFYFDCENNQNNILPETLPESFRSMEAGPAGKFRFTLFRLWKQSE